MEIGRLGGRLPSPPDPESKVERLSTEASAQQQPARGELKLDSQQTSAAPAGSEAKLGDTLITTQMMKLHLGSLVEGGNVTSAPPKKPWSPPEIYALPDSTTGVRFVDADGNPVSAPPGTKVYPGGELPYLATDPWGNPIYSPYPPPGEAPAEWPPDSGKRFEPPEMFAQLKPGGGCDFVDADGNPMPTPPGTQTHMAGEHSYLATDPWGNPVYSLYPPPGRAPSEWPPGSGKAFQPPEIFAQPKSGGGFEFVDKDGNPVPTPPGTKTHVAGEESYPATDPWGNPVYSLFPPPGEAPADWPPGSGKTFQPPQMFAQPKPGGGIEFFDADGQPMSPPPGTKSHGAGEESYPATDPWGNPVYSLYPPPGETPAEWPPGSGVRYQRPEIFAQPKPGGGFEFMDGDGNLVPTPPGTKIHVAGEESYPATDPWGKPVYSLFPPPGKAPAEWPPGSGKTFQPPEMFAQPKPGGGFEFVDRDGNPVPTPPGTQVHMAGEESYPATDPWGNPVYSLYPPPGRAPEFWPPG
ncbi:MAG: hypothetical protein JXQ27_05610 [Acidobacteria bacterium]|nr:hypothetical protein [Acidobacteriota bacterium]